MTKRKKYDPSPFPWKIGSSTHDCISAWLVLKDAEGNDIAVFNGNPELPELKRGRAKADIALCAAARTMYDVLKHYAELLDRANAGDIIAEQKLYEDRVLIEQALNEAECEVFEEDLSKLFD